MAREFPRGIWMRYVVPSVAAKPMGPVGKMRMLRCALLQPSIDRCEDSIRVPLQEVAEHRAFAGERSVASREEVVLDLLEIGPGVRLVGQDFRFQRPDRSWDVVKYETDIRLR